MSAKQNRFLLAVVVLLMTIALAHAKTAEVETPLAPPFPASEAATLADAYVANTFPEFTDLYCSEIAYDWVGARCIRPDPTIVWRLRYLIPHNPRKDVPGSPFPDWGVCLVFVHRDKSVTHTAEPKRNLGQ